jgi:pimeloyl-ACP methyl ester carboxylesterase
MPTARIGDVELHYEEHGSGEPLVLVMGLAADSQAWMFQVPEFSRHYRTVVFDNRGVGRSSKPVGPYTIQQMADDTAGLLDALDIARAHVVGVSMGGMIAQELALRHPARVRGLVLACTYPEPDADVEASRRSSVAQLGGSIAADGSLQIEAAAVDPMMFFGQLLPKVFNPDYLQREMVTLMQLFGGALQWGFSIDAILAQVHAVMAHSAAGRLGDIASPTLVITGDNDLLISPRNSEVLAERIPGAKLVKVPGGSHGFNFETPDVFNRHVLDFLATVKN